MRPLRPGRAAAGAPPSRRPSVGLATQHPIQASASAAFSTTASDKDAHAIGLTPEVTLPSGSRDWRVKELGADGKPGPAQFRYVYLGIDQYLLVMH